MSSPLVSVAVVTYRHRPFIGECLRAILDQDYPRLQIIVGDDHSDDGTGEVIETIARADPGRLTVLPSTRNLGINANHQRVLDACDGDYIAWMAGDDVMLPGKISAQVALMEADPECAVCYHDVELIDEKGSIRRFSEVDRPREGGMTLLARHGALNPATSNMVRATCSPRAFDDRVPLASDWLYYTQCLAGGGRLRYIPRLLGRYRRHAGNITRSSDRSLAPAIFSDHMTSCAILAEQYPHLADDLAYRESRLLAGQRWQDGGAAYADWLEKSLDRRFSLDVFAALKAYRWFGIRR